MSDDSGLDVLLALAAAERRLESAAIEAAQVEAGQFQHLTVRETAQGLWIAAALVLRRADGSEVERTLSARNALDGRGWSVEREVALNKSAIGEPEVLASKDLPTVQLVSTSELSAELPRLLGEVLDEPMPEPAGR